MFNTIKSRFIIISISFIIIAVGLPMLFLVNQFRANFHQRSQIMLEATLDIFENGMQNVMMLGKDKNIQQIVERIASNQNVDHMRIFEEDGTIRYSSENGEIGQNIMYIAPHHVNDDFAKTRGREIRILEDFHAYSAFEAIVNHPECQTCHQEKEVIAYMDVDTHLTRAERTFYTGTLHMIFLGIAVILILTLGLLYLFNKFINKPIKNFIGALYRVEGGDLSTRLKVQRRDEFGILNSHFNNMVNEIESSREKIVELHNEQLRHADKLVTLGELTAQMAHDINNYTGIILSRSDYLLLEAERNQDLKKYNTDIEVIQNEIQKISKITRNVLRHSKKKEIKFTNVDLKNSIDNSLLIIEPIIKKKNIAVNKSFESDNTIIFGDPTEVEQLLTNLFINAADAIEENGHILIAVREFSGKIVIEIEDDGVGMDQSTKRNMFSPFFTTKELDKGTGLGLYIVKNICDQHGAELECISDINEGTKFIIKFPLNGAHND